MKKLLMTLGTGAAIAAPLASTIACGSSSSDVKTFVTLEKIEADATAKALKTDSSLTGYSTDEMVILSNKQETSKQFAKVVSLFNDFYGTNLVGQSVGGTQTIDSVLSAKFATDNHDLLLVSSATPEAFRLEKSNFIDTKASDYLGSAVSDDSASVEIESGKTAMAAASEGFGLIYNKTKFASWGIKVNEGKKSTGLAAAAVEDGVYVPADFTTAPTEDITVYTSDMNLEGLSQLYDFIDDISGVSGSYSLAGTGGDIWPMTNHLAGVAYTENLTEAAITSKDFNQVWTEGVKRAYYDGLVSYGTDIPGTNTVDASIAGVALGTIGFVQNGTWNAGTLKLAAPSSEFGFMPVAVENSAGKLVISKTVSQHWAATDLAKDAAKAKTAKLFLQFLYNTKIGHEIMINDLSFASPYSLDSSLGTPDGSANELFASLGNYGADAHLTEASDGKLGIGFNNAVESFRTYTKALVQITGTDEADLTAKINGLSTTAMKEAWDKLVTPDDDAE